MRSLFESNSSTNKTILNLAQLAKRETIAHEGNDDPKWAVATVKALAKKLKKAKYLDEIEKALINENRLTDCCAVSRELERDKKTVQKKDKPHIFYLKLWRFPWLKSASELKAVDNCRFPFSKTAEMVCVNPLHYDVVHPTAPPLPPILVDKSRTYSIPSESTMESIQRRHMNELGVPNASINADEMRDFMSEENSPSTSYLGTTTDNVVQQCSSSASAARGNGQAHGTVSSPVSPQSYLSEDLAYQEDRAMEVDKEVVPKESRSETIWTSPQMNMLTEMVAYSEPSSWMSITYYEEGSRVGEPFDATTPYLLIDGYTSPSEKDRFCLGYLNNCNRTFSVLDARRHIGRGARFYYIAGEIYSECLSDSAVFIQSPNCNQRHGWHPSTVCKVPPRCNLKVFSNAEFAAQLADCVNKGFEAVYALTRLCTIRMSFVKGWGADYRRQTVTTTPCWVEAHLNGPLQWIDRVLSSMGAPEKVCSSFT